MPSVGHFLEPFECDSNRIKLREIWPWLWEQLLSVQVATAATMSAAGLEAMRMTLFLVEQSASAPSKGTSVTSAGFLLAGMLFLAALPALLAGVNSQT